MARPRRSLSLDPSSEALLSELAEGGGASRYVDRLIADADRDWRAAHRVLRAAGWMPAELSAACETLNGYWQDHGQPASWASMELIDAERISSVATGRGISASRWMELAKRIHEDETEARCLQVFAREFWRNNPHVERLVSG